jgi:hypothetical protein
MNMNRINHSRLVLAPIFLLLAHCGTGGGAKASAPVSVGDDAGVEGSAEAGAEEGGADPDAGTGSAGNPPTGDGGGTCVAEAGAADPPDDMGADTNCDGADGIVGKDVYVDPVGGEDTNDGTPKTPMLSLSAALKLATSRAGSVLVAAGTPADATLSSPGTWAIYGGYGPGFIGPPTRSLTTLTPGPAGLLVDQAASAHLAHMTVTAQMPPAGMGSPAVHAVRSNVAHLELDDMVLQAPQAADGTTGAIGGTALPGCSLPTSSHGVGAVGVSPDGVTQPGNVAAKVAAAPAMAGLAGGDGNDAPGTLALVDGLVSGPPGTMGLADGTPGYGGASGGDGSWAHTVSGKETTESVGGGTGGAGGCPGVGGQPGSNGGSSVALTVLSGNAIVTRSGLQSGLGGTGGNGGPGGPGSAGQLGGFPVAWPALSVPATCASAAGDVMQLNCAAYGGQGGPGGNGGAGGGGAGGWSVGVLTASGANVSLDTATTVTITKAGVGGVGSQGSRAPSGQAHVRYGMP